ncbi:unnamed protein product [Symbiodinium natans]|uniref:Uncharacterized protein n=1 Tax=Symbiodinium natans TaxID=878477 RepID=A0A812TH55_9DINO|nr:unnamed protein product [Symbiodinium natans]
MVLSANARQKIQEHLTQAQSGMLVQSMQSLMRFLLSTGLAYKQRLSCEHVGTHELNRDGLGVSAGHVQDLVSSLAHLGFVEDECKPVCIEVPADSRGDQTRAFNVKLMAQSEGKLPPMDPSRLRFASVMGSHTNMVFRSFLYKAIHPDTELTVNGKLSLEKLEGMDKPFAEAIRNGVHWTVVDHDVQAEFPAFASLMQASGNATNQISKMEDELQIASKIMQSVKLHMARNAVSSVTFADVQKDFRTHWRLQNIHAPLYKATLHKPYKPQKTGTLTSILYKALIRPKSYHINPIYIYIYERAAFRVYLAHSFF